MIELRPASDRHQDLQGFLIALLRHWVEEKRCGVVRSQPFQMKTGAHLAGREPDVLFLASEHLDRLRENHLAGPADLAVEIVSPDTRRHDTVEKLREYEEGASESIGCSITSCGASRFACSRTTAVFGGLGTAVGALVKSDRWAPVTLSATPQVHRGGRGLGLAIALRF